MSYDEIWFPSPNNSGRGGSSIVQVTFHTSEGAQSIESLANWICDPVSQASYHAAVDNTEPNVVGRYVDTDAKAWSQAGGNPFCLSVCFCTPSGAASGWSREKWLSQGWMLDNAAAIAKKFCDMYGIPITPLNASQAQSGARGISQHVDGGSSWSGHHDCGPGFPEDEVIRRMKGQGGSTPPQALGDNVVSVAYDPNGTAHYACLSENGQVMYFPPGWADWGAVDPSQKGALSGAGISISKDWWVEITYTNGSKKPCKYSKKWQEGDWVWSGIGTINAR
jgi:hypothetical protein